MKLVIYSHITFLFNALLRVFTFYLNFELHKQCK
jgi:hypothetical protein